MRRRFLCGALGGFPTPPATPATARSATRLDLVYRASLVPGRPLPFELES